MTPQVQALVDASLGLVKALVVSQHVVSTDPLVAAAIDRTLAAAADVRGFCLEPRR